MKKIEKLNLLLVVLVGIGVLYLGGQVHNLREDVKDQESRIVESQIIIDNGTTNTSHRVQLTRGATLLEGLQRAADVKTKTYAGMGEMITSINGLENNKTTGTYWLIAYRNETADNWTSASTGAGKLQLKHGHDFLLWYGKPSNSPF